MIKILSILIEMALWGSFAALAVIAVRPLIKKCSNRIMCLLWLIVLFRLLCPVAIESPVALNGINNAQEQIQTVIAGTPETAHEEKAEAAAVSSGKVKASKAEEMPEKHKTGSAVSQDLITKDVNDSGNKGIVTVKESPVSFSPALIIAVVWLLGTIVLLVIGAARYLNLHLALKEAVPVGNWKTGKRKIPVKISDVPGVPMSFGIIHPAIYMPSSFKEKMRAHERQDDLIMMHEAMHIRRLDLLFKLAAYVMLAIHWWNPLAWVCVKLIDRDIELACDETVLRKIGLAGRCAYATALLNFAVEKSGLSLAASFGESNAEKRITNALKYKKAPVWLTAVTLTAAVLLGGCLSMKPAATEGSVAQTAPESVQSEPESKIESVISDIGNSSTEPAEEAATLMAAYRIKNNRIFTIDSNGNKVIDVDEEEMLNVFKESGDYLKGCDVKIEGAGDGAVFLSQTVVKESGEKSEFSFYSVDIATHSLSKVYSCEGDGYLHAFDIYDGKIFLTLKSFPDNKWIEIVLEKTGDAYKEVKEPQEYLSKTSGYKIDLTNGTGLRRKLDEAGYLIGSKGEEYYKILPDGSTSELKGLKGGNIFIEAYDKDYVVYGSYSSDNGTEEKISYQILNIAGGKSVKGPDSNRYLDYADGKLYFGELSGSGHEGNTVYEISADTGESRELYTMENIAGSELNLGLDYFRIIDGRIWTVAAEDGEIKWVEVSAENGKAVFKDHGCTISGIPAYKYGTVSSKQSSVDCKKCGDEILTAYEEVFKLDPKYSANADKINKTLAGIDYTGMFADQLAYQPETDEACKDQHMKSTLNFGVDDVALLSEKYLAVQMYGYIYPAGAVHGQPYREQILFDLKTGERINWYDLYTGSEKDFKTLVASKTEEDANSYHVSPYFEENGKAIYDDVYKNAEIKKNMIELYEDHALLVYPPYEMGSYASGYIEVELSYEELLGRSAL